MLLDRILPVATPGVPKWQEEKQRGEDKTKCHRAEPARTRGTEPVSRQIEAQIMRICLLTLLPAVPKADSKPPVSGPDSATSCLRVGRGLGCGRCASTGKGCRRLRSVTLPESVSVTHLLRHAETRFVSVSDVTI